MSKRPKQLLPAGAPAPDFSLRDEPAHSVELADYANSPVILLFYAADFNPVCVRQLAVLNEVLSEFHRRGAQVLGISSDKVWSHIAFSRHLNLHFPLLSDYPETAVGQAYHVPVVAGESARAVYLVDKNGNIVWAELAPPDVALAVNGALEALEKLLRRELPLLAQNES